MLIMRFGGEKIEKTFTRCKIAWKNGNIEVLRKSNAVLILGYHTSYKKKEEEEVIECMFVFFLWKRLILIRYSLRKYWLWMCVTFFVIYGCYRTKLDIVQRTCGMPPCSSHVWFTS